MAQITAQGSCYGLNAQNLLSIGHRPLRGRCPSHHHTSTDTHVGATGTADHLTLLRLFSFLGSGPSGPMSCRTQGGISRHPSILPSFRPPVHPSVGSPPKSFSNLKFPLNNMGNGQNTNFPLNKMENLQIGRSSVFMVSGTRCPYMSIHGCGMVRGAAAPKGVMTYA